MTTLTERGELAAVVSSSVKVYSIEIDIIAREMAKKRGKKSKNEEMSIAKDPTDRFLFTLVFFGAIHKRAGSADDDMSILGVVIVSGLESEVNKEPKR